MPAASSSSTCRARLGEAKPTRGSPPVSLPLRSRDLRARWRPKRSHQIFPLFSQACPRAWADVGAPAPVSKRELLDTALKNE
jgi:hypothetical protein